MNRRADTDHVEYGEGVFAGAGGGEIYWQSWCPADSEPIGVVVIVHGLAEHSGRYVHVAHRLADRGVSVCALDHHGHGKSTGSRANIRRMAFVRADLGELIARTRRWYPDLPVFLLGHSLGGLIVLDYVTEAEADTVSGLLLSGAAVDSAIGSQVQRFSARILSAVAPNLGVLALDAAAVSRDPDEVVRYQCDPLVCHGKVRARTGAEALGAVERVTARLGSIRLPTLIMHGSADRLASPAGAELVARRTCPTTAPRWLPAAPNS